VVLGAAPAGGPGAGEIGLELIDGD
jgi:hypothetical protein